MPSATLLGKRKSVTAQPEAKKKKKVAEDEVVKRIKQKTAKKEEKPAKEGKENTKEKKEEEGEQDISDALSIFQRAFEARFKPIAPAPGTTTTKTKAEKSKLTKKKARKAQGDEDGDEEDFDEDQILDDDDAVDSGSEDDFSGQEDEEDYSGSDSEEEEDEEEEEAPKVMVVDYSKDPSKMDTSKMSKKELKAYLSSKPPNAILSSSDSQTNGTKSKKDKDGADGDDSAAFLANDLALQRLIAESHILSAAGGNASHYLSSAAAETEKNTRAFAEGRIRKKTTDMRMQALGAKGSVLEQEKMPMNMRKGINKAAETYEQKRRREARENGIILEKASGKGKGGKTGGNGGGGGGKKRSGDRPVDMPGIGKMRGAQLTISKRDIRSMENSGPAGRGGRGVKGGHRKRR
ncbi:pre-rRNA processing and 40S ribosomal subunit assembly [Neurospora sp. IMI 360204]|nr:pre-rRNA processing and 40S ribosomal subunit assembly [Neurospora sp. IMI 360204]